MWNGQIPCSIHCLFLNTGESLVKQDSKQIQVDLQDLGYETCGRSENEAEREETTSPGEYTGCGGHLLSPESCAAFGHLRPLPPVMSSGVREIGAEGPQKDRKFGELFKMRPSV